MIWVEGGTVRFGTGDRQPSPDALLNTVHSNCAFKEHLV